MDKITVSNRCRAAGFSLVELLVVVAIITMLMAVAGPGMLSITAGTQVNRGGQLVADALSLARQEAAARSREVEVRFYNLSTAPSAAKWQGIQLWITDEGATTPRPLSRLKLINDPVIMEHGATYSPLIGLATQSTSTLSGHGSALYSYVSVRFRAGGTLDQSVVAGSNFLTIRDQRDTSTPPHNYYTIQINPMTGKVDVYRP